MKKTVFCFKILSKWLFFVEHDFLSQEKSFWMTFCSKTLNLYSWTKIMSWTIFILSWTKCPRQKFCLGRRSRHVTKFFVVKKNPSYARTPASWVHMAGTHLNKHYLPMLSNWICQTKGTWQFFYSIASPSKIVNHFASILIPINLVPNFTHRGRLVIRGRFCSFSQPSAPLGYKQTVSRGRW